MSVLTFLASQWMHRALRPAEWQRWSLSLPDLSRVPANRGSQAVVRVAVVQFTLDPVSEPLWWLDRITECFRQATEQRADIIVFGEDLASSLFGVLQRFLPQSATAGPLRDLTPWLKALSPVAHRYWYRTMKILSQRFAITTVAGSAMTWHDRQLLNVGVTFDPAGREIAWQPKIHLLPMEVALGMSPGDDLRDQVLDPWPLITLVCNDATFYESFRMARLKGALLVAVPIADPEPHYSVDKARRGTWARVQETPSAGLVGASTGNLFGIPLTGKAGIYVPRALTPDGTGVLVESEHDTGDQVSVGCLDLAALADLQEKSVPWPLTTPWLDTVYSLKNGMSSPGAGSCIS